MQRNGPRLYFLQRYSKACSRSLQIEQSMVIPPALQQPPRVAVDGVPLPPRFQDLLLGVDPVLFVLAGFTTTAFIQLIGPFSNPVLCWDGATLLGELFGPTILGCGCV